MLLVSVPYAFKAHEAETLGGLPASSFLRAPTQDQSSQTNSETPQSESLGTKPGFLNGRGSTNYLTVWLNPYILGNSVIYQTGGNVGRDNHAAGEAGCERGHQHSGIFTGSGADLPAYSARKLADCWRSTQLGGATERPHASNSPNVFYGDGSHITGMPLP